MDCPLCRSELCWDSDEQSDEIGYTVKGIISFYHCTHCGAYIEILIPDENEYEEE